ncbi:hypothetical protein ACTQ45_11675 [Fundicoccus sp. Sow4_D5]
MAPPKADLYFMGQAYYKDLGDAFDYTKPSLDTPLCGYVKR